MAKEEEPMSNVTMAINFLKIMFAMSPLIVLGYVLLTGFDDKEEEEAKRKKKTDFQLDGHEE
eukprot:CAMPEP_0204621580 /NCGR_PEP_ID=MMETSP0717-20131115/7240_1 /ASSEMBLY_ACC=CAM_ASM_000666 /TAXON_ID=230516 /ORGANISM="Chaetoceros curvisetus" /LENGTH=61 /DNA_ID=CAMNT_0051636009 /DNA_START=200 /DNA_END=385 /DNA_ORIENTATION=+